MEPTVFRRAACPDGSPSRSGIDVSGPARQIWHFSLAFRTQHEGTGFRGRRSGSVGRALGRRLFDRRAVGPQRAGYAEHVFSRGCPWGLLWGILSIVEYQVSKGAGHRYLRERLWAGDWIAIGNLEPKGSQPELCRVPKIKDAKFGRKVSAIGDGTLKYTGVRIVHAQFDADLLV
jgi:hypothetical protein